MLSILKGKRNFISLKSQIQNSNRKVLYKQYIYHCIFWLCLFIFLFAHSCFKLEAATQPLPTLPLKTKLGIREKKILDIFYFRFLLFQLILKRKEHWLASISHGWSDQLHCLFLEQGTDAFSQSGLYSNHQDIAPRYAVSICFSV